MFTKLRGYLRLHIDGSFNVLKSAQLVFEHFTVLVQQVFNSFGFSHIHILNLFPFEPQLSQPVSATERCSMSFDN